MNILLTGSHGYVGKNLRHYCRFYDDIKFVCVDKKNGVNCLSLTVDDFKDIDCVIHLAANINIQQLETNSSLAIENFEMTRHICDLMHEIELQDNRTIQMIFSSSCQALLRKNIYGLTKFAEEKMIKDSCRYYSVLRFYNVVGTCCSIDDSENDHLLPNIFNSMIKGVPFKIYGDSSQQRSYVHIHRICRAIVKEIQRNCCDTKEIVTKDVLSISDIISLVSSVVKKQVKTEVVASRIGDYCNIIIPENAVVLPTGDMKCAIEDYALHYKLL